MLVFQRAQRKAAKLRLALCGVSGSGKTYSALLIAKGMGGRIAMIDTENGSGQLYSDDPKMPPYDAIELSAPYSPQRYIERIKAAETAGYDILIIDSLSHAWAGEGGILDIHDKVTKSSRSQNSFNAWKDVTPQHNKLVETIVSSNLHIIVTMRSKPFHVVVENERGKSAPVKVGLAPIQREGIEYEFTVALDLSVEGHIASASKDRTSLFDGQPFKPQEETGKKMMQWLNSGADFKKQAEQLIENMQSANTLDELAAIYESIKREPLMADPTCKQKIIEAKDKRKNELREKEKAVLTKEHQEFVRVYEREESAAIADPPQPVQKQGTSNGLSNQGEKYAAASV